MDEVDDIWSKIQFYFMVLFILVLVVVAIALAISFVKGKSISGGKDHLKSAVIPNVLENAFGGDPILENDKSDKKFGTFKFLVRDPWCYYIQIGKKVLEIRRGTKDKFQDLVGQKVMIQNFERKFPARVTSITHYETLDQLLNKENVDELVPGKSKDEIKKIYNEFWSDKDIEDSGGLLVFRLDIHDENLGYKPKPKDDTETEAKPKRGRAKKAE